MIHLSQTRVQVGQPQRKLLPLCFKALPVRHKVLGEKNHRFPDVPSRLAWSYERPEENLQPGRHGLQRRRHFLTSPPARPRQSQQPSSHGAAKESGEGSIPLSQTVGLDQARPRLPAQPLKHTDGVPQGCVAGTAVFTAEPQDAAHLHPPQLFFGTDVGDVGGASAGDGLLSRAQPRFQVGVFFHEVAPEEPLPVQSEDRNTTVFAAPTTTEHVTSLTAAAARTLTLQTPPGLPLGSTLHPFAPPSAPHLPAHPGRAACPPGRHGDVKGAGHDLQLCQS